MVLISDDPIVRCMESTGYPPWLCRDTEPDRDELEEYGIDQEVNYGSL